VGTRSRLLSDAIACSENARVCGGVGSTDDYAADLDGNLPSIEHFASLLASSLKGNFAQLSQGREFNVVRLC
jgi:hypothetical protein